MGLQTLAGSKEGRVAGELGGETRNKCVTTLYIGSARRREVGKLLWGGVKNLGRRTGTK